MKIKIIGALILVGALAGCDSYTAQQYQSNPQNTIALQSVAASGRRATISTVTLAEGVEPTPTCRLAGPIDLGGGQSLETVIKQAFLTEFLAANVHRTNGTPLAILVTELKPDSFSGTWTIGLQATSAKGTLSANRVTNFSTSFTATSACNNTATAFNRALSNTILALVENPSFRSLL